MSYETIEQSEYSSEQIYLYYISGPEFLYNYTNAPLTLSATISSTAYSFTHPRGGIWHGSAGASVDEGDRKQDPGPTESPDAGRTGVDIHVSHLNPIVRKHRAFPPPGDTEITIYRLNEVGGTPYQIWSGVLVETPIVGSTGILRCQHIAELVAGSEGLTENFGPTCGFMFTVFPCPVTEAQATDSNLTVTAISTENLTVSVSGSVRIAGKYKPGVLVAPNNDKRSILEDTIPTSDHVLTLQQNFPSTTLRVGDTVSIIRGCDRLFTTCRDEWGSFTGSGAACGCNNLQANKNPHQIGRLQ
jgi:hypothetical protein